MPPGYHSIHNIVYRAELAARERTRAQTQNFEPGAGLVTLELFLDRYNHCGEKPQETFRKMVAPIALRSHQTGQ